MGVVFPGIPVLCDSLPLPPVPPRVVSEYVGEYRVPFLLSLPLLLSVRYYDRIHYSSFIYPFQTKNGKRMPTEIFLMAIVFCILNGTVQAIYQITPCTRRNMSWLYDPRFIVGAILFVAGLLINWHSDTILRSLRADGSTGYKIPQGGMFTFVSGANYFGESVEWIGYACLSWNLGALAFAIFTIANVGPRAIQHHRWYKKTFGDAYPSSRKALIPFLLSFLC